MDPKALIPTAAALALAYAVSKFVPNPMAKAAAYGVMGVVIAKQIPYVKSALA